MPVTYGSEHIYDPVAECISCLSKWYLSALQEAGANTGRFRTQESVFPHNFIISSTESMLFLHDLQHYKL